jgi:general secretion pathway protein I
VSRYSTDARSLCRARGFSLLEVLVAFVVLALALGVIMRVFSQGMSRVGESEIYARAVTLAESKLAQLGAGIPLEEGETSGESEGALRWRVRLAAYEPGTAKTAKERDAVQPVMPVRLLRVEVEVSWADVSNEANSIRLVALKLAPRTVL